MQSKWNAERTHLSASYGSYFQTCSKKVKTTCQANNMGWYDKILAFNWDTKWVNVWKFSY